MTTDQRVRSAGTTHRRLAATAALVLLALALVGAAVIAVSSFPRGLFALAFVVVGAALAWHGIVRRGAGRWLRLVAGGLLIAAALLLMVVVGPLLGELAVIVALVLAFAAARAASSIHLQLPEAPRPGARCCSGTRARAAARRRAFHLPREARKRGIEPIELTPGDGSRASWCATRSRTAPTRSRWPAATDRRRSSRRSPPSTTCRTRASRRARATTSRSTSASTATTSSARSTRSSTAASGASTSPRSTGRVFVNNVSLGLYAEAVQQEGYRDAKLRTLLDTMPDVARPGRRRRPPLRWSGPTAGARQGRRSSSRTTLTASGAGRLGNAPAHRRGAAGIGGLRV